jgi:hypothetical protein
MSSFRVSFLQFGQVESSGVLDFWGFDWNTIYNCWDVDWSGVVGLSIMSIMMFIMAVLTIIVMSMSRFGLCFLQFSQMESLGVLDFWGLIWNSIHNCWDMISTMVSLWLMVVSLVSVVVGQLWVVQDWVGGLAS